MTITQIDLTYDAGGQTVTNTLGYAVRAIGSLDVRVEEYAILLSPNPREGVVGATTQDGILTRTTVAAGSHVDYGYGDLVAQGILNGPAWWCTEQFQFVKKDVGITLGGEIAPFDMEGILATLDGGPGGTQDNVWGHLRIAPTTVVGKTIDGAFWRDIPETAGQTIAVELRATNIAVKDTLDGQPDPDAPGARVWDLVPAGYVLDTASVAPAGFTLAPMPDGSTRISWDTNLPAADVTGMNPGEVPTPYVSRLFSYRMTSPHLTPGRVALPRAQVSTGADFTAEAHSEEPLMDVLRVEMPPGADAGPGYVAVEGDTIAFTAAASTDPNGDALRYRWDFTADGSWDTDWSDLATASAEFGDDFSGTARVEVTDGIFTDTGDASVVVRNADPSIGNVRLTAAGNLTLRVAGEKWHDVTLEVSQGGTSTSVSIVRMPGSPDEQAATLEDVEIDVTQEISIRVIYTPDDDPVNGEPNGADPVWVLFDTPSGTVRLHHTFNVQQQDSYVWTLDDVALQLIGLGLRLSAGASDIGSDDLMFAIDWGDATGASQTVYNDGTGPDPNPSPSVHPISTEISFLVTYAAAGTYTITVLVRDDDGGTSTTTLTVSVG
ncbi:MAG TPA: hypothetical protein VGR51_02430 [Thermoplasmata archaeon]|nr:hypothetical protein [Thermoplasmata archaeon]